MSLDLLKEFGYYKEENLRENPWEHESGQGIRVQREDDDDFGDFEGEDAAGCSQPKGQGRPSQPTNAEDAELVFSPAKKSEPCQEGVSLDDLDEGWGDFNDFHDEDPNELNRDESVTSPEARSIDKQVTTRIPKLTVTSMGSLSPSEEPSTGTEQRERISKPSISAAPASNITPPSNIPPPSVLLLYTATLFQYLPADLKSLLASLKPSSTQTVDIDQTTLSAINLRLSYARAVARIIAGRKFRWKRDTRLAQSMKIGPAQAGKSGGMKLTGIDKMETRKEDQEAAEVVRIWKQHVGTLRASVASTNARFPAQRSGLAVPEIAENMPVRVAKRDEGALTALKPCVLCGLKRDERVEKVDVNVEDSFGEWWTEHYGHRECRRFWEEHEATLDQRR